MSEPSEFNAAERIAVGAFGEPGQRVFLLEVRQGDRVLTVKVEKGQVAELAAYLTQAMADRPTIEAAGSTDARMDGLAEPAWVVGSMRLGYDNAADRVALVLEEFHAEDEPAHESALIMVSAEQAAALVSEIGDLVTSGRPACPHCGYPLDPSGHVCPKSNGHRPPKL